MGVETRERRLSGAIGVALILGATAISLWLHDSALAGIVGLAGAVLVVYAVIWDRLKKFGPGGVELREFERLKRETATVVDRLAITDSANALVKSGQAAAKIRSAASVDELADAIEQVVN